MADTKKAAPPRGTQTTEKILGSAAVQLASATKSLTDAYSNSAKLSEVMQDQVLKISDYELKIEELGTKYTQAKAEQDFRLGMEYKTDRAQFATEYLDENGLLAVDKTDHNTLKNGYAALKADFEKKLTEREAICKTQLEKDYQNQKAIDESNFHMKEANNLAKIAQLEAQLASSNQMCTLWEKQLNDEREAGVKRAQAGSIGNINIPSSK